MAIELSKSTWVVAIQPPAVDKVSLFRIAGGEIERLFELFEQARRRAGQPIEICACYEAGYDGFWICRALTARGVACTVLDSASIQVSRRARRVKTDRTDAESLVRAPYNSGTMVRDQGISKAGNRRARAVAVELAWIWLRNQPESKLSRWFRTRVGDSAGRVRRIAIVALARKLIVALWHFLEAGVIPEGAKTNA